MTKPEKAGVPTFESAKRRFLYACAGIAAGLGIAGTFDQKTGGVIVILGWVFAVFSLHRLGRAGHASETL